jgi:hypothetical protein
MRAFAVRQQRVCRITLEIGRSLHPLKEGLAEPAFKHGVESGVQEVFDEHAWPARPLFEVIASGSACAVRLEVDGRRHRISPLFQQRVWVACAPLERRHLHFESAASTTDGWLAEAATIPNLHEAVRHYLRSLTVETLRQDPSMLINPSGAERWLDGANLQPLHGTRSFELAARLLTHLVTLGISLDPRDQVLDAIQEVIRQTLPEPEAEEVAFDRLRTTKIRLCGRRELTGAFGADHDDARPALFQNLGVRFGKVEFTPTSLVPDGMLSIKLNDRIGVPVPIPESPNVVVLCPVSELPHGVSGEGTLFPLRGRWVPASIVNAADADKLNASLLPAIEPADFVQNLIYGEVLDRLPSAVCLESVEYELAKLAASAPELVRVALSQRSLVDLVRVLRGLVAERVSIRNYRWILENLLQLPDAISPAERLQAVRDSLGGQIVEGLRPATQPLHALSLAAGMEAALDSSEDAAAHDAAVDACIDACWAARIEPTVIVVARGARADVSALLRPAAPHVYVLAKSEIPLATAVLTEEIGS